MVVRRIFDAVLAFKKDELPSLIRQALDEGVPVERVLREGLIAPLDELGERFSRGDAFVPELLMAARAVKAGLEELRPALAEADTAPRGRVVIGTVQGDLHDIGKNLVAMMLEGAGFRVVNLGVDVRPEAFVQAARESHADLVCMSALLTTTMPNMEATIRALREQGLSCRTMVGGAPVTPRFAARVGADGYSDDAPGAVLMARRLVEA